jgi:kynurenine formamidase
MPRRIIDLSTPIDAGHFRWPAERRLVRSHAAGDMAEATWLGWVVHGFTHMDAPRHFDPQGATTDDIPLETVMGPACVVDVSAAGANAPVTEEMVAAAGADLRPGDIALIRSGWDRVESIATPEFWSRAPWITDEACQWLLDRRIKAVAFDFPQDRCIRDLVTGARAPSREEMTSHLILLLNGVIMFEYLCNMMEIARPRVEFIGLPLKVARCDGAPARAIVIEES